MSINKCKEAPEVIIIFLNSEWTSFPLVLIKRTLGNVVTTTNVQNGLFFKKKKMNFSEMLLSYLSEQVF